MTIIHQSTEAVMRKGTRPHSRVWGFGVRLFCGLVVLLLCSCALQADQGNRPQQENANQAQKSETKPEVRKPSAPVDPNKFALVVAGVGGEEAYTKKFTAQATKLYDILTTQLGFGTKNLTLLTEVATDGSPENGSRESEGSPSRRATAEEVKKAFATIKSDAKSDSFVLIVLIGHGSVDNQQPKFNLIGPDLTVKDYAQLIASLPNKRVVFVNCSSSSGDFIKPLSAEGRIIITATRSGNEQNATIFAEHFIAGLANGT